jgi:TRAP-type C4-dicarboxylate transport system permease small subunit
VKSFFGRVADVLGIAERYGAAAILAVMTFLYGFNVLVRALLPSYASDLAWIDEAARYMMIWVVFLGAGITLEVGRQVSVDLLRGRLAPRLERLLFALIDVVGFVFCAGAAVFSVQLAHFVMTTGQSSPTLGVPVFFIYIAPAAGFSSMAFRFLLRLFSVRDARRQPVGGAWLGGDRGAA